MKFYPGFFHPRNMKAVPRELVYAGVSESRRLQAEYPIGDHLGGPAYGMKAMPVVAVVAAVATFATGATAAFAAGASLGAMVAGGAMMVGAALSAVGAVTGNQKLMKIGGILSLAGGVGVGLMALGGEAAGAAAASVGGDAMGAAAGDAAASAMGDAAAGTIAETAATGAMDAGVGFGANQVGDAAGMLGAQAAPTASMLPPLMEPPGTMPVGDSVQAMGAEVAGATNKVDALGGGGMLDAFGKFAKNNKEMLKMGVDVIGGIAKAVPSDAEKANTKLLEERAKDAKRRNEWWQGPRKGA